MDKDGLVFAHITEYMRLLRRERTDALGVLERRAREENYPISEPETADMLEIMCRVRKPKKILEIGTCIGFSALLMHDACPDAEIVTIERNPVMTEPARKNFREFGAEDSIKMLVGDAVELLPTIDGFFDLIFIDAAKGQYPFFLRQAERLLSDGGVIVADNVLFNGMVATGVPDVRRNKTIVKRLAEFLRELEADASLKTVILPISDGVTVSVRTEAKTP